MAPCHRPCRNRDGDTVRDVVPQVLLRLWSHAVTLSCDTGCAPDSVHRRSLQTVQFAVEMGPLVLVAMEGLFAVFPHFSRSSGFSRS